MRTRVYVWEKKNVYFLLGTFRHVFALAGIVRGVVAQEPRASAAHKRVEVESDKVEADDHDTVWEEGSE